MAWRYRVRFPSCCPAVRGGIACREKMKRHPKRVALRWATLPALCACALPVAPARAEAAGPTTLDTVRVVDTRHGALSATPGAGSALGLNVLQTPAALTVIDRDQLEQRGDSNLNDAISRAGAISAMPHPGNGLSALSLSLIHI